MDNLKLFDTHADYVTYEQSGDMIYPNVSRCIDQRENHYNKYKTETTTVDSAFFKRDVANGKTVKGNYATIKSIKGNTSIWSQRWYFGGTLNYNTDNGTPNNISYGNTATNIFYHGTFKKYTSIISIGTQLTLGHKYYATMTISLPNNPEITSIKAAIGYCVTKGWYVSPSVSNRTLTNGSVTIKSLFTSSTYTSGGITRNGTILGFEIDLSSMSNFPDGGLYIEITNINCIDLTNLFGKGNEPTTVSAFEKYFPFMQYDRTTGIVFSNTIQYFVSKDSNDTIKQMINFDVTKLTGKLNGSGDSVVIFPSGLKSSTNVSVNDTYDEIKKVNNVWTAYKRIGTTRTSNEISGRNEYEILSSEEIYILDNQELPDKLYVETGGKEIIYPDNGSSSTPIKGLSRIETEYVTRYIPLTLSFGLNTTDEDGEETDFFNNEEPLYDIGVLTEN